VNRAPRPLLALALLCVAGAAAAVEIRVEKPWVRSAAQGQATTPAHVDIVSDTALRLVAASSPWARKIELRAIDIRDGRRIERTVAALEVAAGTATRLAPEGNYLALIEVTRAFGNGDFVPITLAFEDAAKTPHTMDLRAQARGLLLPRPSAPKPD
jgi:periplasmic copper chaperone A